MAMKNKVILERLEKLEKLFTQKELPKKNTLSFKQALIEFLKIGLLIMQLIHQLIWRQIFWQACRQHSHLCKPGWSANNEQWCIFRQQFRAGKTLLSDSNNNELLIINLATVRADGILIPVLHKCVPLCAMLWPDYYSYFYWQIYSHLVQANQLTRNIIIKWKIDISRKTNSVTT